VAEAPAPAFSQDVAHLPEGWVPPPFWASALEFAQAPGFSARRGNIEGHQVVDGGTATDLSAAAWLVGGVIRRLRGRGFRRFGAQLCAVEM
jgi:hypothetical protein